MEALIQEYREAFERYVKLSQQETKIRLQVQQARQKHLKIKESMRFMEQDLLEPQLNNK